MLVKGGVPFALGMQFNLPDPFAPAISGQFYNYLAHGHNLPEAARQARRAVKREDEFFVGMVAVYAAHPDQPGRLTWRGAGAQTVPLFPTADVDDLPIPASGLIGRQHELMTIGTRLLNGKKPLTLTLHGAGGIGKTALLRAALLRFAPSFDAVLAIGLDSLPSLESILGHLERVLRLPSPCAPETQARTAYVQKALAAQRTLLGLDNFETLLHARNGGTPEAQQRAKSVYAFFRYLPAAGVTLCLTSREKSGLPGEQFVEVHGLEDEMGAALFYENVSTRRDALHEAGLQRLSAAVGGHPLALRLLAPVFEEQAHLSLETFIAQVQDFLPQAEDLWSEQERHESLRACFAFSIAHLPQEEGGQALRIALARLSVFEGYFLPTVAAPVIANQWPESEAEEKRQHENARRVIHALWERGLLERTDLPLQEQHLYRLHPSLRPFVAEHLPAESLPAVQENYFRAMRHLAWRAYPGSREGGVYASASLAAAARAALPDMWKAAAMKTDAEAATLRFHTAFLQGHFGDLDGAMGLYRQALDIEEGLGDLKGKSATLHEMADIFVTRGDLDGAMGLYRQSLEIKEGLGDLKGKSATLAMLGQVLIAKGAHQNGISMLLESLQTLSSLGARPDAAQVAQILVAVRQGIGKKRFDAIWQELTASPLPDWLL